MYVLVNVNISKFLSIEAHGVRQYLFSYTLDDTVLSNLLRFAVLNKKSLSILTPFFYWNFSSNLVTRDNFWSVFLVEGCLKSDFLKT